MANYLKTLKQDFPASIVVFFVALPLCLGIALASGAPLFSGLIAGIVGGILVGALSQSHIGVSGPAAGLAVIVLQAITDLGDYRLFLCAVVLAGIFQLVLGLIKAGVIGYFFPSSVIKGMLTGIGIIIIFKQIPHIFGYDADPEGEMSFLQPDGENTFSELGNIWSRTELGAIAVSFIAMIILLLWELKLSKVHSFFRLVQGPIVAVVAGIIFQLVAMASGSPLALSSDHLVNVPVPTSFNDFLSQFQTPRFDSIFNYDILIVGLTIAVVASLETLLSVEATDKLDPEKRVTPTNRELLAQGTGNVISGLIGGLPITQVIIRSSANVQSGGKTKLSAILHGFMLLLSIILIPKILNTIPIAALACVLLLVGYKLAKPSLFKKMYSLGKGQFIPFLVTVLGVVFTDLLIGIVLGLSVGIIVVLYNSYRNSHFLHKSTEGSNEQVRMVLAEEVTFFNKAAILRELEALPDGVSLTLDIRNNIRLDFDVLEILEEFIKSANNRNIQVTVISNSGEYKQPESIHEVFDKRRIRN